MSGHRQERAAGWPRLRHKCGRCDSGGRFGLPANDNCETRLLDSFRSAIPCKQTPLASYNTIRSPRGADRRRKAGKSLGRGGRRLGCAPSADTQLVDAFPGLAANSAKERAAVAAEQGIRNRLGAVRAVELGGNTLRVGHAAIIAPGEAPRVDLRLFEPFRHGLKGDVCLPLTSPYHANSRSVLRLRAAGDVAHYG